MADLFTPADVAAWRAQYPPHTDPWAYYTGDYLGNPDPVLSPAQYEWLYGDGGIWRSYNGWAALPNVIPDGGPELGAIWVAARHVGIVIAYHYELRIPPASPLAEMDAMVSSAVPLVVIVRADTPWCNGYPAAVGSVIDPAALPTGTFYNPGTVPVVNDGGGGEMPPLENNADAGALSAEVAAAFATTSQQSESWIEECKTAGGWPIVKESTALRALFWPFFAGDAKVLACRYPLEAIEDVRDVVNYPENSPYKTDVRAPIGVQFRWWIDNHVHSAQDAADAVTDYIGRGLASVVETGGRVIGSVAGGVGSALKWPLMAAAAVAAFLYLPRRRE